MNKWPITLGALTVIMIGLVATLAVAGVFDSDSAASPGDGNQAETAALCIEGAEDCNDTVAIPVGDEDDVADEPLPGDNASGTCPVGTPDCDDTPGDGDPGLPISNDVGEPDDGEALAIEAAFAKLEAMGGPPSSEVDVSGVESVTWNNACLGVETPGIACAQVITPGYTVFLSGAFGDYEFHTDTMGNAVFAPQD